MPAVFVHGVPDTFHVWDEVREHLPQTDSVALALPGFGCTISDGFTATKEEYADWIISQLEHFAEPVHLVGHDWGCLLTARVASLRPDLVRTWAAGSGPVSAAYEWHPLAKIWQAPVVGEAWMATLDTAGFSRQLEEYGVPDRTAAETASRIDPLMKGLHSAACTARRSQSGANGSRALPESLRPGLVFWGISDPACPVVFADHLAADTKDRARRQARLRALDPATKACRDRTSLANTLGHSLNTDRKLSCRQQK